MTDVEAE